MKGFWFFFCLVLASVSHGESRLWTSKTGSQIKAEFHSFSGEKVVLQKEDGARLTLRPSDFSPGDQAFLKILQIKEAGTEVKGIDAKPGVRSGLIACKESPEWHYYVYLPKAFHLAKKWPVWFIMSAGGGNGGGPLTRYQKGADALGCILILSEESKNKFRRSQEAVAAVSQDVYARFPVKEGFAFTSGFSGGSRMAYLLAEMNREVAGVLACGSGGGVYPDQTPFRNSDLRPETYVYSLVGTNCFNRTGTFKTHQGFPDHYRLRFFPGKHVWANQDLIEEGMTRVMGEALLKNEGLAPHYGAYLTALARVVEAKKETAPWESYSLAALGAQFGPERQAGYFTKMAATLAAHPQVILAQGAEADIVRFCEEFYEKYDYFSGDRDPNEKREKRAASLAAPYSTLPHAKILKRLGQKS